jgi:hypothetical protein
VHLGGVEVSHIYLIFLVIASCGNLLLPYVNSKICTIRFGFGVNGAFDVGEVLSVHNMYGRSLVGYLQWGGIMCMGGAMKGWCCNVCVCVCVCFGISTS